MAFFQIKVHNSLVLRIVSYIFCLLNLLFISQIIKLYSVALYYKLLVEITKHCWISWCLFVFYEFYLYLYTALWLQLSSVSRVPIFYLYIRKPTQYLCCHFIYQCLFFQFVDVYQRISGFLSFSAMYQRQVSTSSRSCWSFLGALVIITFLRKSGLL